MAKTTQMENKIQGSDIWAKFLKVGQMENKKIVKNITANLVQTISHISKFFIFVFNFRNTELTSFDQ